MHTPVRILLADDHTLVREALRGLLEEEPDLAVVGEAGDGDEAIELALALRPDVVLLDVELPGRSGAAVARELRRALPRTRVLVLTAHRAEDVARTMLRMGVHGFLDKGATRDELVSAIRVVHAGGSAFGPAVAELLARQAGLAPGPEPTARELAVLELVARGLRNREVANDLGINESTVEFHLRNLFRKLEVSSRTALVRAARERGWAA